MATLQGDDVSIKPQLFPHGLEVVDEVTWQDVLLWSLPMALVSGLGGVPFFFIGKLDGKEAGYANSLACGEYTGSLCPLPLVECSSLCIAPPSPLRRRSSPFTAA